MNMKRLVTLLVLMLSAIIAAAQRSEGTAIVELPGRSVVGSLPKLTCRGLVDGTVRIAINVDQYGTVTEAIPDEQSSSITNKSVIDAARIATMRYHFTTSASAPVIQNGTVTYSFVSMGKEQTDERALKFMGIPVDGSEKDMVEGLNARGFSQYFDSYLTGLFNGEDVRLFIKTNHNLVDRIKVEYPYCSEENDTRIKYNTLLSRFNRNAKYVSLNPRDEIPPQERIYRAILSNSRHYDVCFFYLFPEIEPEKWKAEFFAAYNKRYSKPVESLSYDELEEVLFCLPMSIRNSISGVVWFTIPDIHHIIIYYDNIQNRPRGEDL